MFTGIISHLGKILTKTNSKLAIRADKEFVKQLKTGLSVAVNGICLTVVASAKNSFTLDYMPETAARTNLKYLTSKNPVNLELPATPNSFLSGHIVQGHIDAIAKLVIITKDKESFILKFSIPKSLSKYIAAKGSVAINGISLTVIEAGKKFFTVGIISYTWKNTMLSCLKKGDLVNVEVDILAKYAERFLKNA